MLILQDCTPREMTERGQTLFHTYRGQLNSFEQAAQVVVRTLYNDICQPNGNPLFALLRVFRFSLYKELHREHQAVADPGITHWLTLMATIGEEQDWCDRRLSRNHQVIPADKPPTPMFDIAFKEIGLRFGGEAHVPMNFREDEDGGFMRYFFEEQAHGSPNIPDQADFVVPYQIQSVVGTGSVFANENAYILIGFTHAPIDETQARKFARLNPFIATLFAYHEARVIWEQH